MAKLEGLPVAGYRPQSQDAVKLVNINKVSEERLLLMLDALAQNDDIDKRWLAIGRTHIEQGFMAVNRAIFKPARAELSEDAAEETGWLIERGDSDTSAPLYFTGDAEVSWTKDNCYALRFAREVDAARLAKRLDCNVRICEHAWS